MKVTFSEGQSLYCACLWVGTISTAMYLQKKAVKKMFLTEHFCTKSFQRGNWLFRSSGILRQLYHQQFSLFVYDTHESKRLISELPCCEATEESPPLARDRRSERNFGSRWRHAHNRHRSGRGREGWGRGTGRSRGKGEDNSKGP